MQMVAKLFFTTLFTFSYLLTQKAAFRLPLIHGLWKEGQFLKGLNKSFYLIIVFKLWDDLLVLSTLFGVEMPPAFSLSLFSVCVCVCARARARARA